MPSTLRCLPLLAAVALVPVGCGPPTRFVNIDSKPAGATIFVNGEEKGVTPAERIRLVFPGDATRRVVIQLAKERYRPVFQSWVFEEVPQRKLFTLEEN